MQCTFYDTSKFILLPTGNVTEAIVGLYNLRVRWESAMFLEGLESFVLGLIGKV